MEDKKPLSICIELPANQAKKIKKALCGFVKEDPISLMELIERYKGNMYTPDLSEIKLTDHRTGNTYTLAEIDKMLNN